MSEARKEEQALLGRMALRDPESWSRFLELYGDLIYSQVNRIFRRRDVHSPSDEAADIVQGLFESLMADEGRKLRSFEGRGGCSLGSWLRTVATNYTLSRIRQSKPCESLEESDNRLVQKAMENQQGPFVDSPRETAEKQESMERLGAALGDLSDRERLIFQLYYGDEYTRREVSVIVDTTPNNVDQYLYQIRRKLKERMGV